MQPETPVPPSELAPVSTEPFIPEPLVPEPPVPEPLVPEPLVPEPLVPLSGVPLRNVSPPKVSPQDMSPDQVEDFVRSAMHQQRSPGVLVVVVHPHRLFKVPRDLFKALGRAGFEVRIVETAPNRVASVEGIRDTLLAASKLGKPLDMLVISGDGSLDHHVLVGAFWAFYPDLIQYRPGLIEIAALAQSDLESVPAQYRSAFLQPPPPTSSLEPTESTLTRIWLLRAQLEGYFKRKLSVEQILRKTRRQRDDPELRVAVAATLLPHKVTLRAHGFDLSGLATADRERIYQGLYPYVRSICFYPAGTAADNAVFAGVPGWVYAQFAPILVRLPFLDGIRRAAERSVIRSFLDFFLKKGVVAPERLSVVGLDGDWQRISSHAAGGPAAGRFFTADLTSKTSGMLGYLKRIPSVILQEGVFGSTVVRVISRFADGRLKSYTRSQLAEGLFTNRAFIAGVGSVPTTGPTSFAGQSSLLVIPPIFARARSGERLVTFRGLGTFVEAIAKGILARALHLFGLGVGRMAGGGKLSLLPPENQVAIKEGEEIEIRYMTLDGRPKAVPIQVSGDPYQAWEMKIRSSWAPIPVLGQDGSLLLSTTRSVLADLRLRQTYGMRSEYIGGVHYFCHHLGEDWDEPFQKRSGLMRPLRYLPLPLGLCQKRCIDQWKEDGAGEFLDTSQSGIVLGRRGRYAINNDHTAHLVVLREPNATLLVRQIRAQPADGVVYECRSRYRATTGVAYMVYESQTIAWKGEGPPSIVQEDHWFRDAQEFQRAAPTFFPLVGKEQQVAGLTEPPDSKL